MKFKNNSLHCGAENPQNGKTFRGRKPQVAIKVFRKVFPFPSTSPTGDRQTGKRTRLSRFSFCTSDRRQDQKLMRGLNFRRERSDRTLRPSQVAGEPFPGAVSSRKDSLKFIVL